mmetsp:Transcript_38189/g.96077  ORF Transcript_38189/g.96077 Transcript_38189/m.96077 type:complete len:243 (+) Transcript_38189:352-1080(+)
MVVGTDHHYHVHKRRLEHGQDELATAEASQCGHHRSNLSHHRLGKCTNPGDRLCCYGWVHSVQYRSVGSILGAVCSGLRREVVHLGGRLPVAPHFVSDCFDSWSSDCDVHVPRELALDPQHHHSPPGLFAVLRGCARLCGGEPRREDRQRGSLPESGRGVVPVHAGRWAGLPECGHSHQYRLRGGLVSHSQLCGHRVHLHDCAHAPKPALRAIHAEQPATRSPALRWTGHRDADLCHQTNAD